MTTTPEAETPKPAACELADWSTILDEPARHIALYGGRSSGKSYTVSTKLVLRAAAAPPPGLRILCCREYQTSISESSKKDIEFAIERLGLESYFKITDKTIEAANGSVFIFKGLMDAGKTKSMSHIDICWIEEAQTISRQSVRLLTPTIRAPGSQLIWTWNPSQPTDPVDEMFRGDSLPPRSLVRRINYTENPHLPDEMREEMEWDRSRDLDDFAHTWLGEYEERSEARVLKNLSIRPFKTPDDARLHYGMDFGYSVDPTVVIRSFIGRWEGPPDKQVAISDPQKGQILFVDHEAHALGCPTDDLQALLMTVPDVKRWPIVADSARPEIIDALKTKGFSIVGAKKGDGSIKTGIEYLRAFDIVVHPRCKHAAAELPLLSWKMDKQTGRALPILVKGNDHFSDALRYSHEGMRPPSWDWDQIISANPRPPLLNMWSSGTANLPRGPMWR